MMSNTYYIIFTWLCLVVSTIATTNFKLPAPLPTWPPGTNFASGVINIGAIEVAQITSFDRVCATSDGGPDNQGISFYEPAPIPDGFLMLGCYGQPNNQPLYGWVLVAKDVSLPGEKKPLALPTDYTLMYNIGVGYIWLPVAPAGYSAMGYVVTASSQKPSPDKVRVVRSELTDDVEYDNWIWGNNGLDIYGLKPKKRGSKALGISVGTFTVQLNGNEMHRVSCLTNVNFNYPSMPNLDQVQALIKAYSPVVYFDSDEKNFPSTVNWFFQNGALLYTKGQESSPVRIADNGWNLPQNGSNDGAYWIDLPSDKTASENLKKGDLQSAYAYMHIKPALGGTFTDIQVWLFYPFNGPTRIIVAWITINSVARVGEHVGDWEHVTLRISNFDGELKSVYFSKHGKGDWMSSPNLEFDSNNKPVVYSSRYMHASYSKAATFNHNLEQEEMFIGPQNVTSESGYRESYYNPPTFDQEDVHVGPQDVTSKSGYRMDTGARYWILGADYLGGLNIVEEPWLNFSRLWGPKKEFDLQRFLRFMEKELPGNLFKQLEKILRKRVPELLGEEGPTGPKWKDMWRGDERV